MSDKKRYLGDGLFADHDGDQFVLTAENGISAHDTVYLDGQVFWAFLDYAQKVLSIEIKVKPKPVDT